MHHKFPQSSYSTQKFHELKLDQDLEFLRDLMTVVPGPYQSLIGISRSSLNFSHKSMPQTYTRMLHILKTSDKEYVRENVALDTFLLASLVHFSLAEQIQSENDLNFLITTYAEAFRCRKISALQKHPKIVLSRAYADLIYLRKILFKADFIELKNTVQKHITTYSKHSSIPEMKIVITQLLSIKAICKDLLCQKDAQALLYRVLQERTKVSESFANLYTGITNQWYAKATINLALRLIEKKTENWIIRANYQISVKKIFEKFCNEEYLPDQDIEIFTKMLQKQTSKQVTLNKLTAQYSKDTPRQQQQQKKQKKQSKSSILRTRRTLHYSSSDSRLSEYVHKSSLHSLSTTNRALLIKNLLNTKQKVPSKKQFTYSTLKKPNLNQQFHVISNQLLQQQLELITTKPLHQKPDKMHLYQSRTSIMDQKKGKKRKIQKRRSRSSKLLESIINLEELTSIKFLKYKEGNLLNFEVLWDERGLVLNLLWSGRRHQILLEQSRGVQYSFATLMGNVKNSIQSSPLYFEFFHNIKDPQTTEKIELLNFIAKKKVTQNQLKAAIYLKQFVPEYILEGHAYVHWLSGFHFIKRQAKDANEATKLSNDLKDIRGAFSSPNRVPCSDLFRQQNKKSMLGRIGEMLTGALACQITKLSGEYVLRLVDFNTDSFQSIWVYSKKLKLTGVELSLYTLQIDQLFVISKESISNYINRPPGQILSEKILHVGGICKSTRLKLLKQSSSNDELKDFLCEGYEPPEGQMELLDDTSDVYSEKERRISGHNIQIKIQRVQKWMEKNSKKMSFSCLRTVPKIGDCYLEAQFFGNESDDLQVRMTCKRNREKLFLRLKILGFLQNLLETLGSLNFLKYTVSRVVRVDLGFNKFLALPAKIWHLPFAVVLRRMNRDRIYMNIRQALCKMTIKSDNQNFFVVGLFRNKMFKHFELVIYDRDRAKTTVTYLNQSIFSSICPYKSDSKSSWTNSLNTNLTFTPTHLQIHSHSLPLFQLIKTSSFFNSQGTVYKQLHILKLNSKIILVVVDCIKQTISTCRWNEQDFERKPKQTNFQKRMSEEIIDLAHQDKLNLHIIPGECMADLQSWQQE